MLSDGKLEQRLLADAEAFASEASELDEDGFISRTLAALGDHQPAETPGE